MRISLPEKFKQPMQQIDFSEIESLELSFNRNINISVDEQDFQLLMIIISEEIASKGMIDQNVVNEYGKLLYQLYDALLPNKPQTA